MAILDLDNIIIRKTNKEFNCLVCGGELKEIVNKTKTGKIIEAVTMGMCKTKQYECETCQRKYMLI